MTENKGDLISREALKEAFEEKQKTTFCGVYQFLELIDNAPTVEENEKPFVTECRNTAIEKGLPLYFLYYEETGAFEVYKTDTKELFEKRRCVKHMEDYEFQQLANRYLDDYSNWINGADMRGANNG